MRSARDVLGRGRQVRLFDEGCDVLDMLRDRRTRLNISLAGRRMIGRNSKQHDPALARRAGTSFDRSGERCGIFDPVVGGHQEKKSVSIGFLRLYRRDRRRGRRISRDGFKHERRVGDADRRQLLGDQKAVLVVRDHHHASKPRLVGGA